MDIIERIFSIIGFLTLFGCLWLWFTCDEGDDDGSTWMGNISR